MAGAIHDRHLVGQVARAPVLERARGEGVLVGRLDRLEVDDLEVGAVVAHLHAGEAHGPEGAIEEVGVLLVGLEAGDQGVDHGDEFAFGEPLDARGEELLQALQHRRAVDAGRRGEVERPVGIHEPLHPLGRDAAAVAVDELDHSIIEMDSELVTGDTTENLRRTQTVFFTRPDDAEENSTALSRGKLTDSLVNFTI